MDIFRPGDDDGNRFDAALRSGIVVDLHNVVSEMLQTAAGAFLLRKVYRDMFRWGYAEAVRLVIVLDEAHRLARDITLPKIMKEGRKFGVAVVAASQGLADFHPDVLKNVGTKIAFRANHIEARKIAGFFHARGGQDLSGLLEGLGVGQAIVQTPEMQYASRVVMQPPN
jgi:DNA helicase HerA-like ATPase